MIAPADPFLEPFVAAGADLVTVHAEAGPHLDRSLARIRELGAMAGVALNPATPPAAVEYVLDKCDLVLVMTVNPGFGGQAFLPAMLPKLRALRAMIGERPVWLQVDGGIAPDTAALCREAGADILRGRLLGLPRRPGGLCRQHRRAARRLRRRLVTGQAAARCGNVAAGPCGAPR